MAKNTIAFANLRAEMARANLSINAMAPKVGMGRDTLSNKLRRKSPIALNEAYTIKHLFFPDCKIEYLFKEVIEVDGHDELIKDKP